MVNSEFTVLPEHICSYCVYYLWSPYGIGQTVYVFMLWFVMVTLCNRADHYIFILFLSSSSFFYFLA